MQFYLIVPLIFIAMRLLHIYATAFLLVLLIISKVYEARHSSRSDMFNFLEGRLWQFVVGILAYDSQHIRRKLEIEFHAEKAKAKLLPEPDRQGLTDSEHTQLLDIVS